MEKLQLVQVHNMPVKEMVLFSRFVAGCFGCQMRFLAIFLAFLAMCYLEFSKSLKMNIQTVNSS